MKMDARTQNLAGWFFGSLFRYIRGIIFRVLSVGEIPHHIAFILDGNRRYCHELGVKYVTIYAFSIDNFKRRPDEVQCLMDLMLNKVEGLLRYEAALNQYGVRVVFIGNLRLLDKRLRASAEMAMDATRSNSSIVLLICVAYTSTDEMLHAAQVCCRDKRGRLKLSEVHHRRRQRSGNGGAVMLEEAVAERGFALVDLEKHMQMGLAPEVDILVRTSGETRLSNFLLWQTSSCLLYSPRALFPEIGLRHLVWAVLNFQRLQPYFHHRKSTLNHKYINPSELTSLN
ncbi:unnamed protein product [Cuscuta epithymum]|uniref:Alkyl transferase n=1 Tax=Cuscuta epithymum TaxID=186058 RepID=A0AAV0EKE2_9ASTE|nr:unnamed protein product [Cuscuta epithymum]